VTARIAAAAAVAALALAGSAHGAAADGLVAQLDAVVPALMREYRVPGLALAVVENQQTVIRTYGVADQASGRPITATTPFNVGSVSKTFASWGALRLVAERKLDLDAPVERYVKRWRLPPSSFDRGKVTLRRLLSHTAGLSVSGYVGWTSLAQRPTLEASLSGNTNGAGAVELVAEPGAGWSYSGGGYTLAQLLVEEQSGKPFEQYLDDDVFPAMGLADSRFTITPERLARMPRGHDPAGRPAPTRVFTEMAAAGLSTTITDLAALATLTIRRGVAPDGRAVVPRALFDAMVAPQVAAMPADRFADLPYQLGPGGTENYGLGYDLYRVGKNLTVVGHTGANLGWRAGLFVALETGQGIAVTTNADGGRGVRDLIICHWSHHVRKAGAPNCPKRAAPLLQGAYEQGGVDAMIARAQALRKQRDTDFSDVAVVDAAFSIMGESPDPAQQSRRAADGLRLLRANLDWHPASVATLIALAFASDQAGDAGPARKFAERALAQDLTPDERRELEGLRARNAPP
jgi:CubicO group peptidase (beta-lactamase class C family)